MRGGEDAQLRQARGEQSVNGGDRVALREEIGVRGVQREIALPRVGFGRGDFLADDFPPAGVVRDLRPHDFALGQEQAAQRLSRGRDFGLRGLHFRVLPAIAGLQRRERAFLIEQPLAGLGEPRTFVGLLDGKARRQGAARRQRGEQFVEPLRAILQRRGLDMEGGHPLRVLGQFRRRALLPFRFVAQGDAALRVELLDLAVEPAELLFDFRELAFDGVDGLDRPLPPFRPVDLHRLRDDPARDRLRLRGRARSGLEFHHR